MITKKLETINVDSIVISESFNSRGKIRPIDVSELASDIEEKGQIQPITVRPLSSEERLKYGDSYKYFLVAGFRRTIAIKIILQQKKIDAVIRYDLKTTEECYVLNLSENFQRTDLTILQEAYALKKLKDLGISEVIAAKKLNKSRGWIQIRYMVLALPDDIQQDVDAGIIDQASVRDLYSIQKTGNIDSLYQAAKRIKNAKIVGGKKKQISARQLHDEPQSKRVRKRGEIFEMMEHVQDQIGNNICTRGLAWCAGEISNLEFFMTIRDYAISLGKTYHLPSKTVEE